MINFINYGILLQKFFKLRGRWVMKELLKLFLIFAKIGAVTFGGGYAMLPILQREIVEKYKWADEDELLDYFAIGQCTPGIIAVNTATFIGHKNKGVLGGIFATLGVIAPSIVIITIITAFIRNFAELPVVIHAFNGIRICVCVLILNAVLKLAKTALVDAWSAAIFVSVFLLAAVFDFSAVLLVILAGAVGYVIKRFKKEASDNGTD